MVRTHVTLPKDVLDRFDQVVGPRKRSEKVAELVEEFLRPQALVDVIAEYGGSMDPADHPEVGEPGNIAQWAHDERRAGERQRRWPDGNPTEWVE